VNKGTPPQYSMLMRIKSYFGLSQPGGLAAIAGQGFGAQRGTVVAKLKAWNGAAKDVSLTVIVNGWSPTLIEVQWPDGIDGVRDQMHAVVEVTDATRVRTASWTVFFRAETDYKVLPMSAVRVVKCGDDSNYSACNNKTYATQDCLNETIGGLLGQSAGSFWGYHANCWATVGNDSDTDEFEVRLKNDWAIAHVDFKKGATGRELFKSSEGAVWNPSPPAPTGKSAWNARVKWEVTPNDTIAYCAFIHISGPKGVPFK
jgi:hypothetical protein